MITHKKVNSQNILSREMGGGNRISNAAQFHIRMNKAELKALRGAFRAMALCTGGADAYAASFLVRGKTNVFP